MTTCACGCGEAAPICLATHKARGYVAGKPFKYIKGHHRRKSRARYLVDSEGCWIWQGWKNKLGYALMQIYNKEGKRTCYPVHRANYEKIHGPIPKGLEPDHICENRSCINPDHIELRTVLQNRQLGRKWVRQRYLATIFLVSEFNIIAISGISPTVTNSTLSEIFISQLLFILTKSPNAKMLHVNANPVQIRKIHDHVGQEKGTARDLFVQVQ